MIKLLDKNNEVITLFVNLRDYYIQSTLEDAEKLIHFRVARSTPHAEDLIEENYLETEDYRFLIKEVNFSQKDYIQVFGKLDTDDLRATLIRDYESVEKPLSVTLDELLMGTGWTHNIIAPHRLRTVRVDPEEDAPRTIKEIILRAMNTYDYEVEFDSLNKVVRVRDTLGADRGAYLQSELNIRRLERQSDTYDFRTRLYAYGKDDLTFADINGGKDYVEDFSFSNKILETIWKDDRYTVKENLLDAAHKKLAEIAKPRTSFAIEILQLTNLNPIYSILDYRLGDSVKLIDSTNEIIETHRIVKLTEYPLTPEKNQIELSNTQLRFKTTQREQIKEIAAQEATKTETALMKEIDRVNQLINSPEKGFVIVRKDENGNIYEQLIMDTDNVATAQNVWRWNIHGLAHSSTGYNGDYELALTSDGSINASMITTGLLNGEFIEAGTLQAAHIIFGGATLDLKLGEMDSRSERAETEISRIQDDFSDLLVDVVRDEDLGPIDDRLNDYLVVLNEEVERVNGLKESVEGHDEDISVLLNLQDTIMKWNFIDNYMVVSEDGLEIGQKGSATRILITPDSIDFFDGSTTPVASITGQMLTINRGLFVQSAQIGEHQIETITGGHTTFTWMGG